MKNVLIIMWIVIGIITLASLYITNSTDCFTLLGLSFAITLLDVLIN